MCLWKSPVSEFSANVPSRTDDDSCFSTEDPQQRYSLVTSPRDCRYCWPHRNHQSSCSSARTRTVSHVSPLVHAPSLCPTYAPSPLWSSCLSLSSLWPLVPSKTSLSHRHFLLSFLYHPPASLVHIWSQAQWTTLPSLLHSSSWQGQMRSIAVSESYWEEW